MNPALRVPFDDLLVGDDQTMLWDNAPFTGVAYETNGAGRVVAEAAYVDGVQRGPARDWYDSGQLRSESEYAHGSKHGLSRTWYDDGRLESETEYQYSVKVREKHWDRNGKVTRDWSMPENDSQRELIKLLSTRFGEH